MSYQPFNQNDDRYLRETAQLYYLFNEDHVFYHNWDHAVMVDSALLQMLGSAVSPSLRIAAFWHDAVYFPGAPNGFNEKASSLALNTAWRQLKIEADPVILQQAMSLIEMTSVEDHLRTEHIPPGEWAYLMDADLSSLALPQWRFLVNQQNILRENFLDHTTKENLQKSVSFLNTLAAKRMFIYHTTQGRERWEGDARRNIREFTTAVGAMK